MCVYDDPKLLELHTNLLQSISGPLNPQEIAQVDLALGCQHTYLKFYKLYMIISQVCICFQVEIFTGVQYLQFDTLVLIGVVVLAIVLC